MKRKTQFDRNVDYLKKKAKTEIASTGPIHLLMMVTAEIQDLSFQILHHQIVISLKCRAL